MVDSLRYSGYWLNSHVNRLLWAMKTNVTTSEPSRLTLMVLPSLHCSLNIDSKLGKLLSNGIVEIEFREAISRTRSQYLGHTRSVTLSRIADERAPEKLESNGALDQGSLVLKRIRIIPTKTPVQLG